jgi:hypothetical protein
VGYDYKIINKILVLLLVNKYNQPQGVVYTKNREFNQTINNNMKKYLIYDGEDNRLMPDNIIVEAKTGKEAIEEYLQKTNRSYKLYRSASNDVLFKAQCFYERDGNRYRSGNAVWYAKK